MTRVSLAAFIILEHVRSIPQHIKSIELGLLPLIVSTIIIIQLIISALHQF